MSYRVLTTKTDAELAAAGDRMLKSLMIGVGCLSVSTILGQLLPSPSSPMVAEVYKELWYVVQSILALCGGVFLLSLATWVEDEQVRTDSAFQPLIFVELPGLLLTLFGVVTTFASWVMFIVSAAERFQ